MQKSLWADFFPPAACCSRRDSVSPWVFYINSSLLSHLLKTYRDSLNLLRSSTLIQLSYTLSSILMIHYYFGINFLFISWLTLNHNWAECCCHETGLITVFFVLCRETKVQTVKATTACYFIQRPQNKEGPFIGHFIVIARLVRQGEKLR